MPIWGPYLGHSPHCQCNQCRQGTKHNMHIHCIESILFLMYDIRFRVKHWLGLEILVLFCVISAFVFPLPVSAGHLLHFLDKVGWSTTWTNGSSPQTGLEDGTPFLEDEKTAQCAWARRCPNLSGWCYRVGFSISIGSLIHNLFLPCPLIWLSVHYAGPWLSYVRCSGFVAKLSLLALLWVKEFSQPLLVLVSLPFSLFLCCVSVVCARSLILISCSA